MERFPEYVVRDTSKVQNSMYTVLPYWKKRKKKHLYLYKEILEEDTRPKRPVIDRAGVGMDTWGTKRGRLLHCTFFVKYIFILNCVNVLPTQK